MELLDFSFCAFTSWSKQQTKCWENRENVYASEWELGKLFVVIWRAKVDVTWWLWRKNERDKCKNKHMKWKYRKKGGEKEVEEGEFFKYKWFLSRKWDIMKIGERKKIQTRNVFYLNFKKKTTKMRGTRLWACGVL